MYKNTARIYIQAAGYSKVMAEGMLKDYGNEFDINDLPDRIRDVIVNSAHELRGQCPFGCVLLLEGDRNV